MLVDGLHIPLTTPFYPDGRLNLRKLEHNVERFCRTPAAGLLLLGPTGEATTLSDAETRETLAAAIAAAAPEKVMLAGIRRDGLPITLDLLDHAAAALYDAALIAPPNTLHSTQIREAITFLQTIADRSPLPLVLTGSLCVDAIVELAHHPNILGYLDLQGSNSIPDLRQRTATVRHTATVTPVFAAVTARMQQAVAAPSTTTFVTAESLQLGGAAIAIAAPPAAPVLKTRMRETGFQILTGSTFGILEALRQGAAGTIPAFAACAPQACYEVLAGFKDGDQSLAEEKQARLLAAARIEQLGVPALKYAADLNGYFGGHPRLPLLSISTGEKAEVDALIQPIRN